MVGSLRVVLASQNAHKAREIEQIAPEWSVELLDVGGFPPETGSTFLENARAKAAFGREHAPADAWVLGEDSGIEVDALDGRPGIFSARFAGAGATDEANVAKLLSELEGVPAEERTAHYVCELVCLTPDGEELRATGTLHGAVTTEPRGAGGFGYDPVFVPRGATRTVAELGDDWKTANSHRARAVAALRAAFRERAEPL